MNLRKDNKVIEMAGKLICLLGRIDVKKEDAFWAIQRYLKILSQDDLKKFREEIAIRGKCMACNGDETFLKRGKLPLDKGYVDYCPDCSKKYSGYFEVVSKEASCQT